MDNDSRVRKKRWDVKVHYIRREYNSNIVPDARPNRQANKQKGSTNERNMHDHP